MTLQLSSTLSKAPRPDGKGFVWTASKKALLGTASDLDVADALGITRRAVRVQRMALRIAAYRPPRTHVARRMNYRTREDGEIPMRDEEIVRVIKSMGATAGVSEAARLCREEGLPVLEAAKRAGVDHDLVEAWMCVHA